MSITVVIIVMIIIIIIVVIIIIITIIVLFRPFVFVSSFSQTWLYGMWGTSRRLLCKDGSGRVTGATVDVGYSNGVDAEVWNNDKNAG